MKQEASRRLYKDLLSFSQPSFLCFALRPCWNAHLLLDGWSASSAGGEIQRRGGTRAGIVATDLRTVVVDDLPLRCANGRRQISKPSLLSFEHRVMAQTSQLSPCSFLDDYRSGGPAVSAFIESHLFYQSDSILEITPSAHVRGEGSSKRHRSRIGLPSTELLCGGPEGHRSIDTVRGDVLRGRQHGSRWLPIGRALAGRASEQRTNVSSVIPVHTCALLHVRII
jgi:hypothetical protein